MIQRKQTIFLLLIAAIAAVCLFADPLIGLGEKEGFKGSSIEITYTRTTATYFNDKVDSFTNSYLNFSIWVILGFSIIAIFLFKNRKLQAMLVGFNFIFIGVAWFFIYYYFNTPLDLGEGDIITPELQAGAFYTVLLPILNWLALRGIIADERLVKSMDRLR